MRCRCTDADDQALEVVCVDLVAYFGGQAEQGRVLLVACCAANNISAVYARVKTRDSHIVCSSDGESSILIHELRRACCHILGDRGRNILMLRAANRGESREHVTGQS